MKFCTYSESHKIASNTAQFIRFTKRKKEEKNTTPLPHTNMSCDTKTVTFSFELKESQKWEACKRDFYFYFSLSLGHGNVIVRVCGHSGSLSVHFITLGKQRPPS